MPIMSLVEMSGLTYAEKQGLMHEMKKEDAFYVENRRLSPYRNHIK